MWYNIYVDIKRGIMIKQQIKKTYSKSNQKPNHIKFKFLKDRIIADTEKTVLVCITPDVGFNEPAVWVSRKILYTSEWTNYVSAYIPEGFTFGIVNADTTDEISGEKLKELISIDNL